MDLFYELCAFQFLPKAPLRVAAVEVGSTAGVRTDPHPPGPTATGLGDHCRGGLCPVSVHLCIISINDLGEKGVIYTVIMLLFIMRSIYEEFILNLLDSSSEYFSRCDCWKLGYFVQVLGLKY